jgi:RNA polymerase sigma-70 factor, ECF subfamily
MEQERAMEALIAQRDEVLAYVYAIVGDGQIAEDVLQELAILVLRKHAEIADARHFPGWIRRSARFLALHRWRDRRRDQPLDEAAIDAIDAAWDRVLDHTDERMEYVRACVQTLAPRARQLIALRYGEGLSGTAIAARLGRPLNTVQVGLYRLHRALAECIRRRQAVAS